MKGTQKANINELRGTEKYLYRKTQWQKERNTKIRNDNKQYSQGF